jgi:hypothetical protein
MYSLDERRDIVRRSCGNDPMTEVEDVSWGDAGGTNHRSGFALYDVGIGEQDDRIEVPL